MAKKKTTKKKTKKRERDENQIAAALVKSITSRP
jgi:hypothetical protein